MLLFKKQSFMHQIKFGILFLLPLCVLLGVLGDQKYIDYDDWYGNEVVDQETYVIEVTETDGGNEVFLQAIHDKQITGNDFRDILKIKVSFI